MASVFKKIFKRKRLLIILAVVLLLFFIGRGFILPKAKSTSSTTVKRGEVKEELTLSGQIEADEHVNLTFPTGGLLTWVGVKEGDYVQKYQAIASLDTRQLRKNLDKILADYLKTRYTFDQTTKDDFRDKVLTDTIKKLIDKSQLDLDKSVLDVELQNIAVSLATITTPISGIVTRVDYPYSGINILAGQTPFEIVNPETLYFQVTADQTEVIKIHEGETANIVLDSFPNDRIAAIVRTIAYSPKSGETGTVYEIKIDLKGINKGDRKYKLGMTGDINFITREINNVLYLPSQYIKSDSKGKFVLVGKDKKKVYIETGLEGEDKVEVKGLLTDGEVVYD